jgi:hypothetical protein
VGLNAELIYNENAPEKQGPAVVPRGRFRNHWEICRNPWRFFEIIDKLHAEIARWRQKTRADVRVRLS